MKILRFAVAIAALLPLTAAAAPKHPAAAAKPATYVCSKCHMTFSAANAKKDHYKDPMDGGTLVAVKSTAQPHSSMSGMHM